MSFDDRQFDSFLKDKRDLSTVLETLRKLDSATGIGVYLDVYA